MKKMLEKIKLILFLLIVFILLEDNLNVRAADDTLVIQYFYSSTCSSCEAVSVFLEDIMDKNKNIQLNKYNIYKTENIEYLNDYCDKYGVPEKQKGVVPIVFVRDRFLYDKDEIIRQLDNVINDKKNIETIILDRKDQNVRGGLNKIGIFNVIVSAVVNGFNPCSFSMFMFLIILISSKTKQILKVGLFFCLGKILSFVLIGSIFYQFFYYINNFHIIKIINILMIICFLSMAFMNVYDFVVIKKNKMGKIKVQLPTAVKKVNHEIMKKYLDKFANSPILGIMAIFLGMIVASTEFLCSGQLYLSTIVAVIQNNVDGFIMALGYLILYSVICTMPLIGVLVLLSKGVKEFEMSLFVTKHLSIVKMMYAIVFVLMAIICWFQII